MNCASCIWEEAATDLEKIAIQQGFLSQKAPKQNQKLLNWKCWPFPGDQWISFPLHKCETHPCDLLTFSTDLKISAKWDHLLKCRLLFSKILSFSMFLSQKISKIPKKLQLVAANMTGALLSRWHPLLHRCQESIWHLHLKNQQKTTVWKGQEEFNTKKCHFATGWLFHSLLDSGYVQPLQYRWSLNKMLKRWQARSQAISKQEWQQNHTLEHMMHDCY